MSLCIPGGGPSSPRYAKHIGKTAHVRGVTVRLATRVLVSDQVGQPGGDKSNGDREVDA